MKIVVTLLLLSLSTFLFAQREFPDRCEGQWNGTMELWSHGVLFDSVQVAFTVKQIQSDPVTTWMWVTEYQSVKHPMIKEYVLRKIIDLPDYYDLDEGQGVVIRYSVYGDKMYSLFKVGKTWLTASYELIQQDNVLLFEVTSATPLKLKSKGVKNYGVDFVQRVRLKKFNSSLMKD